MNIYNYIPSPDIAAHCEKIGHVFNPLEMAVIVAMSDKTMKEKHAAWREIIANYPDMPIHKSFYFEARESLHNDLRELIAYEEKQIEAFYAPADGVVFRFSVMWMRSKANDWSDRDCRVYSSVDKAWSAYRREFYDGDRIAKVKIQKEQLDSEDNFHIAYMNSGGELLNIALFGTVPDGTPDDLTRIFIHLPVPFKKGDLVTDEHGKPWVLESIPYWCDRPKYEDFVSGKIGDGSDMMGYYYYINEQKGHRISRNYWGKYNLWRLRFFTDELTGQDCFLKHLSQFIKNEDIGIDELIAMFLQYRVEARAEYEYLKRLDEWYLDSDSEKEE